MASKSTVNEGNPIRVVKPYQAIDASRGFFAVALEPIMAGKRQKTLRGMPLYKDSSGQRWALA